MHEEQQKNMQAMREAYYKRHKGNPPLEMTESGELIQLTDPRAIEIRVKEGRANQYDIEALMAGANKMKDDQFQSQNSERVRQENIIQFFPEMAKRG